MRCPPTCTTARHRVLPAVPPPRRTVPHRSRAPMPCRYGHHAGDRPTFKRQRKGEDLARVFCSELIAAAYQRVGLLESYPRADSYVPRDFSSEPPLNLRLLNRAKLSGELYLKRSVGGIPAAREPNGQGAGFWFRFGAHNQLPVSNLLLPTSRDGRTGKPVSDQESRSHRVVDTGQAPSSESLSILRKVLKRTPIASEIPDMYKRSMLMRHFRAVIVDPGDIIFEQVGWRHGTQSAGMPLGAEGIRGAMRPTGHFRRPAA